MLKLCSLQQAAVLLISHESVPKKGNKLLVSYNITKQMPCTIKTLYCMLKAEGSICVNVLFQDTKLKKHVLTCGLVLAIHCTDKGDATDAESGVQEEDILFQDEIHKSRLASIKRLRMLYRRRKVFSVKEIAMN
ncbi:hypothetical protein Gorai_021107 [Gossypium raimondii]|uniref:Uncharacterized protein n=1 Tax=Gossypium raimondii TaxID=29730 RepID=A0A7J8NPJ3_GOSRA|nr:hypothetical protein [Gossypium raimondii]